MAEEPLFCDNLGQYSSEHLSCCFTSDQGSPTCRLNFTGGCSTDDCLNDCSDPKVIFQSKIADYATDGNGHAPIRRFATCANVPAMAGYLSQTVLKRNISSSIGTHISPNPSHDDLKGVTSAVTQCLTSTCQYARHPIVCEPNCSAVNLLTNNTTPNIRGVNDCLFSLCHGGWNSLPYTDADVMGIGVFASYLMQCMLIVILFFTLCGFQYHYRKPQSEDKTTGSMEKRTLLATPAVKRVMVNENQKIFGELIVQFHKAQCYFSATMQIASLSYGIFGADMLKVFTLTPLATNGVLPVVFAFVILFHCGKSTMDVTLPTLACWLLSSLAYWALYSSVLPFNQNISADARRLLADKQFIYKLSANDDCGGYSALAACPIFQPGKDDLVSASHRLRVLTPIIWTFSTICLLAILVDKLTEWICGRNNRRNQGIEDQEPDLGSAEAGVDKTEDPVTHSHANIYHSVIRASITYWIIMLCFLAGIGMQLSLLSIGTSLRMMDRMHWSFGQVVAVTIWVPPIFGWFYAELEARFGEKFNFGDRKNWKSQE